jgi:hypothetical protein
MNQWPIIGQRKSTSSVIYDTGVRSALHRPFCRSGDACWICAVEGRKLYRCHVKVTGANAWTMVKPPKPTL